MPGGTGSIAARGVRGERYYLRAQTVLPPLNPGLPTVLEIRGRATRSSGRPARRTPAERWRRAALRLPPDAARRLRSACLARRARRSGSRPIPRRGVSVERPGPPSARRRRRAAATVTLGSPRRGGPARSPRHRPRHLQRTPAAPPPSAVAGHVANPRPLRFSPPATTPAAAADRPRCRRRRLRRSPVRRGEGPGRGMAPVSRWMKPAAAGPNRPPPRTGATRPPPSPRRRRRAVLLHGRARTTRATTARSAASALLPDRTAALRERRRLRR